ncbi:hypothetical protein [Streptomyces sp. NBC_00019]|uniref:hypothetical protein n=1 Tax=Streptomyces sp. NBC_00019 TaxID=2975623 RepID=UPI0032523F40
MTAIRSREPERRPARVLARVFITTDVWQGYACAAAVAKMAPRLPALRHRVVLGETVSRTFSCAIITTHTCDSHEEAPG